MNIFYVMLFLLISFNIGAQSSICNPRDATDIIERRRVDHALDDLAKELMSKHSPITGNSYSSYIVKCDMLNKYERTDGNVVRDCIFLQVRLGWYGLACFLVDEAHSYYEIDAIIVFKGGKIVDFPEELINKSDSFSRHEKCRTVWFEILKGDMEKAFEKALQSY